MNKKIILCVIALTMALVLLSACNLFSTSLQDINSLLKDVDYSEVVLNVTTVNDGYTLNGVYTLTFDGDKTTIDYSYDRLNGLSLDGDNADKYVTNVKGVVVVENGVIVEGNAAVELPQSVDFNGLSFKQMFFINSTITNSKFEADVIDPDSFVGARLNCTDMHVTAQYSKKALSKIAITYVSDGGADVSITYLFTK